MKHSIPKYLLKLLKKDFEHNNECSYAYFISKLTEYIKNSPRSIEEQKFEAMTIINENEHKDYLSVIALSLSVASLVMSIILSLVSLINNASKPTLLIITIATTIIIAVLSVIAIVYNRSLQHSITYYSMKLHCINSIESASEDN